MQLTRIEPMAVRDKAIALAGAARAQLRALERTVDRGIVLATAEGVPSVLDKLNMFKAMLADAHAYAGDVLAPSVAAAMGDTDPVIYSGGTGGGKEDDTLP